MIRTRVIAGLCGLVATMLLAACGGGSISDATIAGSVSKLAANQSVTLADNGSDALTVTANGNFTFAGKIAPNSGYNVSVTKQPAGQTCLVTNGSGVIDFSGTGINNVSVNCNNNLSLGGALSGLAAGGQVIVQNNSTDTLVLTANGSFAFPTKLALGATYNVIVSTQPTNGQVCTVTQGAQGGVTSWTDTSLANAVQLVCQ